MGWGMAFVAQSAEHQRLGWIGGSTLSILLDSAATGGSLMVMSSELSAGDAAPLHQHSREDEVFLLLTGSAVVWCGDERFELGAGGVAYLPRDVPHTYRVTSDQTRMLTLCTPAGLEGFFRAAGHDLSRPLPDDVSVTPARLGPASAAHGVTLLGPPPAD